VHPPIGLEHLELGDFLLQLFRRLLRCRQCGCRARHLLLRARGRNLGFLELDAHAVEFRLQIVEILFGE